MTINSIMRFVALLLEKAVLQRQHIYLLILLLYSSKLMLRVCLPSPNLCPAEQGGFWKQGSGELWV